MDPTHATRAASRWRSGPAWSPKPCVFGRSPDMTDLSERSTRGELMDEPGISVVDYNRCLADLEQVNRYTLTHRATLQWLDRAVAGLPPETPMTILDVACGHGDLLRAIYLWAR